MTLGFKINLELKFTKNKIEHNSLIKSNQAQPKLELTKQFSN